MHPPGPPGRESSEAGKRTEFDLKMEGMNLALN